MAKNNMAYFDEKSGQILLTPSEKSMFKECEVNASVGRTPTADKIIKWVLEGKKNENTRINNTRN